jgi:hypothetical protein
MTFKPFWLYLFITKFAVHGTVLQNNHENNSVNST